MSDKIWWYTARAGGLVAWLLLAASVLWGLLLSTRILGRRPGGPWLLDLHRYLGGIAVVFVAIHIAGLVADDFVYFGWSEVLVPMASEWRPGAVAWGVVGFHLLVAVEVTSLLRRHLIPETIWRRVHYLAFLLFGFSTVHAIQSGSDITNRVMWAVGAVTVVLTVRLGIMRLRMRQDVLTQREASDGESRSGDRQVHRERLMRDARP